MRFLLSVIFAATFTLLQAQGKLEFAKDTHNFGEIKEDDGFAEFTFDFVNTGDQAIRITNVKASCGCTTPGWTKEDVLPGESGFVKARYNPRNRPGNFRKSLSISTSLPGANKVLYISGMVKPKPKSPLEELPISSGNLRLRYRSLNFGKLTTEKTVTKDFDVYNGGSDSLSLQYQLMEVPNHITLEMVPSSLAPKEKGLLKISYDPIKKDDLGFISDNLTIQVDSVLKVKNQFNILATIEEYFPEMTAEELDRSPKLQIAERVFDFGKAEEGQLVSTEFELTNAGQKKLNFRKIKSNCACVTYEVKSQNIKKGKSQILKVTFDTASRKGNQYKTVTIFSNDPSAPTQMVTIKGKVTQKDDSK